VVTRRTLPRCVARRLAAQWPAVIVDCAIYQDGTGTTVDGDISDALDAARGNGRDVFMWIALHEPTAEEFELVAQELRLHPLAVEDAVEAHQRPKLERYDDTLFMVLKTVRYRGVAGQEVVATGEIMVFLGRDFVITVRHGEHSSLHDVRQRLEADPEQLALGPSAVLHAIADRTVDAYLAVTAAIEDDLDELEREVFTPRSAPDSEKIYAMKREVLELRRAVVPLGGPLRKLTEGYSALVPHDVRSYFRDVDDHLVTVTERIAAFNELLTTLVDAALAKITMQQNGDMRKITSWVAIVSVPTMVAGIYGMNFDDMPWLHWHYGFATLLALTAVACLLLVRVFRRNQWL
jgi:magnesium transporter